MSGPRWARLGGAPLASALGGLHRRLDWTRGCFAVTDAEIAEIWRLVPDRTIVEIRG